MLNFFCHGFLFLFLFCTVLSLCVQSVGSLMRWRVLVCICLIVCVFLSFFFVFCFLFSLLQAILNLSSRSTRPTDDHDYSQTNAVPSRRKKEGEVLPSPGRAKSGESGQLQQQYPQQPELSFEDLPARNAAPSPVPSMAPGTDDRPGTATTSDIITLRSKLAEARRVNEVLKAENARLQRQV